MKTRTRQRRTEGVKPTVFVVDDDKMMRAVMVSLFQDSGLNSEAFTGTEPELVGAVVSRADAVLLDKNLLPDETKLTGTRLPRSGLDIAQRIKQEAPWVKIALFSAEGAEPPQHMAPHDAFIEKIPGIPPSTVVNRVKSLLAAGFPELKTLPESTPKKKKN